jgi:hypothetical protein
MQTRPLGHGQVGGSQPFKMATVMGDAARDGILNSENCDSTSNVNNG